ncbi:MAG: hypothetical protein KatS3mg008_1517 [Acidimicrobiales bacterium]|nr:MAG: hypothetical protein KatS3mg008_1517 [Acidimicrobiales bacterium]
MSDVGPFSIVVVLLVVIPAAVLISGGIACAILSTVIQRDVEKRHPGSELLELNR